MSHKFADIWAFFRILTPVKVWNMVLVGLSFYLSRWLQRPIQWGLPISVSIEPTTACNLRCPECPSGLRAFTRQTGNLRADFFRQTIDDIHARLCYLIFYFQGEPYINPNFLEMVAYAAQKGIYTMTSTNGHFLDSENARKTVESGLHRLIISIDGATQETYSQYRREGNLQQVLDGARQVVAWKKKLRSKTPHIVFQFLVVRPNEHEIPQIRELAREIGVDELRLKTAQVYDYRAGNALIPTLDAYSRYRQEADGSWSVKSKLANYCWKLWHSCVITWDGKIVPCCFDKDAKYQLGDLRAKPLAQVWKSETYNNFRKALLKGRSMIDICTNCTEGL